MQDFGVETLTSLRDATGDIEPDLIFSFLGLGVCALRVARGDTGRAVFEEPAEASVKELRLTEATRPRYTGVFSTLARPVRDGQELRRKLLTGFLINGPLQAMSARQLTDIS